jgi:thioredoxin-like negative regulator of GroEL
MKPVVDRLQERYKGTIEFRRLNTDAQDAAAGRLADSFGVQYVPTFVFLNRDGSRSDLVVGEVTEEALVTKLSALR